MGILEKISEIEKEIARTQKNKATEYHLGLLKAKLAKYRAQLLEPSKSASSKGEGFDVMKSGDARVALIGFPSVGKSTFLSLMTSTASEAASYEFTTLTCIPGVIEYKGANIQLLDLPGIIEGAAQGKGRGRQVIAVARTADVVIMMLDATKGEVQRSLLEKELESVGIRLNKHKPNIYFKVRLLTCGPGHSQVWDGPTGSRGARGDCSCPFASSSPPFRLFQPKKGGGISFNSTVTLTQCSEKLVQLILHEYKIFNAEVLFREDCSPDEFIDVIVGNRVYMPCFCGMKLNLDSLLEMLWEYLALTCIYTKKRGRESGGTGPRNVLSLTLPRGLPGSVWHPEGPAPLAEFVLCTSWLFFISQSRHCPLPQDGGHLGLSPYKRPDFTDAIILRKGASVEHVCHRIHRSLASQFKYALVWGTSTKYSPQRVGLTHTMEHEDVIQIVKK
ncbi:hypothetical protein MC885_002880 [Smutsia gigantea]|nr:hypothetical protein MC885_002880 [Smutsia gigantea]